MYTDVNTNRKLILYKDFKVNFCHEYYLDVLKIRKFRNALEQIRTGHHPLEIESGRYIKTARERRLCKLCMLDTEDEYHFVLKCDRYTI